MKKAISGNIVQFTFEGLKPLTFNPALASTENQDYARMHGFLQRLGDAAAIPRQDAKGNVVNVTEAMRRDAVAELITHYESGSADWNLKGGKRGPTLNPIIVKLAAAKGIDYAAAQIMWSDREAEVLASL
jgi:hypothetical protein